MPNKKIQTGLLALENELHRFAVTTARLNGAIHFTNKKTISFLVAGENFDFSERQGALVIPEDYLANMPEKIAGIILSKLSLNTTVFARNCRLEKLDKIVSEKFLNAYHLMNSTSSAFNYGLYLKDDLQAVASFSKGRKMRRLAENKRSFELIRFCCKPGITVTGGLTKLLKNFYEEKKAGDIMTYVDKQLSDGSSFLKAGFKKTGETDPNYFLVNKKTFERMPVKGNTIAFDNTGFYLTQNSGNIKMLFKPLEKL